MKLVSVNSTVLYSFKSSEEMSSTMHYFIVRFCTQSTISKIALLLADDVAGQNPHKLSSSFLLT
jgi:hypothetical protein